MKTLGIEVIKAIVGIKINIKLRLVAVEKGGPVITDYNLQFKKNKF